MMKTLLLLSVVVSVLVLLIYFRENLFPKKKDVVTNQSYISFMQSLCEDEFVTTSENAGFYESDNNLFVSSYLYTEDEGLWNGKEVVLINVSCASPVEGHVTFFERLKNHVKEWRGNATCTWQYGKTDACFELDIRVPMDVATQHSLLIFYKRIITFLADECGLSKVVRYVKSQVNEDTFYYEFVGIRLNRFALYVSADNEWSSDMEDMHETLACVDIDDTEVPSMFITSEEFEKAYRHIE